jgi:hypothetical protein
VLAIIALLVQYANARIPMASGHAFETLLLGFIVLLAGNLLHDLQPLYGDWQEDWMEEPARRPAPCHI